MSSQNITKNSELLPCPFCGGEAELHPTYDMVTGGTLTAEQVRKAIFDCSSYASYDGAQYYANGINMQAIADELNTRAERTCKNDDDDCDAWFKCSECGLHSKLEIMSGGYGIPNYCPNCGARVIV